MKLQEQWHQAVDYGDNKWRRLRSEGRERESGEAKMLFGHACLGEKDQHKEREMGNRELNSTEELI